jgi:enoyl-CoA hydratase
MKEYKNILVEKNYRGHPHVAKIQLNRPKVLNALSTDLMFEVAEALLDFDRDPDVRITILTGDDRAFAAGADIAQMVEANPVDQITDNRFLAWQQLELVSKPILAAVNGFAFGGGCELAMSCDLIIAGDKAQFGQPEIKIGTTPGAGGTQRLTRAIGKSKAMMMVLTGEPIDAYTAYEWGLVAKVVPAQGLMNEAFELASTIANRAPVAVKLAKESVKKSFEMSLKDGMDFERRNFYLTFSSTDQKEGMKAFLEKRNPVYNGR